MIRSRLLAAKAIQKLAVVPSHQALLTPLIATRYSSLSAIHRGIRQSDRIQGNTQSRTAQGRHPRDARVRHGYNAAETSPGPFDKLDAALRGGRRDGRATNARTTRALAGAATPRQRAKLRKKLAKQVEEEEEEEDGKQTRRKRFVDPEASHGKRSLVYQLKYGALKDKAAQVELDEPVRPTPFRSRTRERDERNPQRRTSGSLESRNRGETRATQRYDRDRTRPEGQETNRRDHSDRPRRDSKDSWDPNAAAVDKARKGGFMPLTVKYTTAASQFLYGRSVVKAALSQARRKLYHLYIYGNEARIDKKDDDSIRSLAHFHKVPITVVPEGEQRLMDKMSSGRPHNGYVLETSPLPQPPVAALGRLVEEPGKLGFNVTLGHQTKEELDINGEDTFMARANNATPKPFVLLLNEILDPGNLGGLIRTASYLGIDAIGVTSRSSSTLTPVVLKSAAGAVEEVTIFTVDDPVAFIESSKKEGWKTYASVAPPARKLTSMHAGKFLSTEDVEQNDPLSKDPCILVLGNEGHGLSRQVKVAADYELSVPRFVQGHSSVDSLNVSVAAGLLCHAFVKPSTAKARRPGRTGAVEVEPNDEVSRTIKEQARELF